MELTHAFKYLSAEVALNILLEPTIKFSTPFYYNDPFDCNPFLLEFNITQKFIDQQIEAKVLTLTEEEKAMSELERIEVVSKLYNSEDSNIYEGIAMTKKSTWISCLSQSYKSILMWSHYSNKHTGICIGYDFNKMTNHFNFWPSIVKYLDEFEKVDYCKDPTFAMEHVVSCKSKDWDYEEEIRIRTNRDHADMDDNGIIKISKDCISHIILGMNYNVSNFKESMLKLGYNHVKFIKLHQSKHKFELIEEEL